MRRASFSIQVYLHSASVMCNVQLDFPHHSPLRGKWQRQHHEGIDRRLASMAFWCHSELTLCSALLNASSHPNVHFQELSVLAVHVGAAAVLICHESAIIIEQSKEWIIFEFKDAGGVWSTHNGFHLLCSRMEAITIHHVFQVLHILTASPLCWTHSVCTGVPQNLKVLD